MSSPITRRERLHEIIFESDTPAGRAFDLGLIIAILVSVALVIVDSVAWIHERYQTQLYAAEWFFTALFSVEYVLRLLAVKRPVRYAFSFFGLVDLFAVLPTYLSLLFPGAQSLLVVRAFRLMRVFRVFKLGVYLGEARMLHAALVASRPKIIVFLVAVAATVTTMGAVMYLVEGPEHGFTSIPLGIYWAIVTMTTVGFGDLYPKTPVGQAFASALMIVGYGMLAVPTGIVTTELVRSARPGQSGQACPSCSREGHDIDAAYCKYCGARL